MEETAELLTELSTFDEAEVMLPGGEDHIAGVVPDWCEVVLALKRRGGDFPIATQIPMVRHDGELIIELLHNALHPDAGGSALMGMWVDLDEVVDDIQARIAKGKEPLKRDTGLALGLTIGIARVMNPFNPDVDMVRTVAMERWESRQETD